jgi:hypothetical protein
MTRERSHERSHAFLTALLETTTSFILDIDRLISTLPSEQSPTTVPMKFRLLMTHGQEYRQQGPKRLDFYSKVAARANEVSDFRPFIDYSLSSLFQLLPKVTWIKKVVSSEEMSDKMKGKEASQKMEVDKEKTEDQPTNHPTTLPRERTPSKEVAFESESA